MDKNSKISEIIQKNFISKISYFSQYNNMIKVIENEEFVRVDSMLPSDTFNICVIKNSGFSKKEDVLRENTDYFNKKSYPAAVWIWEDNSASEKSMADNGFALAEKEAGMYIDTENIAGKEQRYTDFEIRKVSSDKDMEDFSEVISSIFGESEEASNVKEQYGILKKEKIYASSDMSFYTGYYNNKPVSCGTVYQTAESTGIYDVATKENYRKKGLGSAMFAYLMSEAKKNGNKYCILQASADGAGIYRKMGFIEVCSIDIYENRDFLQPEN